MSCYIFGVQKVVEIEFIYSLSLSKGIIEKNICINKIPFVSYIENGWEEKTIK